MLQLEDFYPINEHSLKKEWDKALKIPNEQWNYNGVSHSIEVINDQEWPRTLRAVKLNMLPALAIEILRKLNELESKDGKGGEAQILPK